MTKKLNSRQLKTLPIGDHRDGQGLMFRVNKDGSRTWTLAYAQGTKRRKMAFGEHPAMSLSQARTEALRLRSMVAQGRDPKAADDAAPVLSAAVEEFINKEVSQLAASSQKSYTIFLRNELIERFGHLNLSKLTRHHLATMIDEIQQSGRAATASGAYRVVRRFLNWAMKTRQYIEANPMDMIAEPKPPKARDRILSDEEITAIHGALDVDAGSTLVRLLFLTGCRLNEVAQMRRCNISVSDALWTIPDTKNGTTHLVPLSDQALTIVKVLLQNQTQEYLVSGSGGAAPYSGFSKAKSRIDRLSGVESWRFHDIRRSVATILRRSGVGRDVVKAILNHTATDVTSVYDRYDMLEEKRNALELLYNKLSEITHVSASQTLISAPPTLKLIQSS